MHECVALIQARMSSARFPGKMLAPLCGRPLISHVLERVRAVGGLGRVVVVTSEEVSDDPLALYVESQLGVDVFRGDLRNVVRRFQQCLERFKAAWFVRISGDSPLIDPELIGLISQRRRIGDDLISNVVTRTFPPGQSVEVLWTDTFMRIDALTLQADEQEHVTLHYYRHPDKYSIRAIRSRDETIAARRLVVDSIDDLHRIEQVLSSSRSWRGGYATLALDATD